MTRKPDIFDLYAILRKRNVSVGEWLAYNSINSLKDYEETAEQIAANQGCCISEEFKADATNILEKRTSRIERTLLSEPGAPIRAESFKLIPIELPSKKKGSKKKSEVVVSDILDPATTNPGQESD